MHSTLIVINDLLLLACSSMYFGTGWSLVLFSFGNASRFTVDNYYDQFIPQVTAATRFFTGMTIVMLAAALVMTVSEWHHRVWAPVIVFVATLAATLLTEIGILPLNRQLGRHIRDPKLLQTLLGRWMNLNRVRVALWTVQWLALAVYYGLAIG
jgi:hypothetical protein